MYDVFILFVIFAFGAAFGSFLNVVIDRTARSESLVGGRSYCEKCGKKLLPQDLIPLVSFLLLGAKCRFCHKKIPGRLFLVELIVALLAVFVFGSFLTSGLLFESLYVFVTSLSLIGIFFADIEYGIIPDELLVLLSISATAHLFFATPHNIPNYLLSAVGSGLVFLAIYLVTRGRGMGFGDVKLAFVLGLFLGFPKIIASLYLAFLTGAIVGIILVLWRKKKLAGGTIPFGPFLVLAAFVVYFWGDQIITQTLRFLGL